MREHLLSYDKKVGAGETERPAGIPIFRAPRLRLVWKNQSRGVSTSKLHKLYSDHYALVHVDTESGGRIISARR
jgi:hypothetical protein